jgi:hypothetical protein
MNIHFIVDLVKLIIYVAQYVCLHHAENFGMEGVLISMNLVKFREVDSWQY